MKKRLVALLGGALVATGVWGADDGNIRGSRRFVAQVGVVMVVHAAFAALLAAAPR